MLCMLEIYDKNRKASLSTNLNILQSNCILVIL